MVPITTSESREAFTFSTTTNDGDATLFSDGSFNTYHMALDEYTEAYPDYSTSSNTFTEYYDQSV